MQTPQQQQIEALCKRVLSGEFQDEEDVQAASKELGRIVCESWKQPLDSLVQLSQQALVRAMNFPEHKQSAFGDGLPAVALALARAQIADNDMELQALLAIIIRLFTYNVPARSSIILLIGHAVSYRNASVTLLRLSLESLRVMLEMTPKTSSNATAAKNLLAQKLLPLHSIQGKLSPTQSLLGAFHRELTLCVSKACELAGSPEVWEMVLCDLAGKRYPPISEGNSPKEVLFLHELEKLVTDCPVPLTGQARSAVVSRLLSCISSLHAAVCERALSFWRSDQTLKALQGQDQLLTKTCERALAKTSLEHWSPTVKSMAGAALLRSTAQATTATGDASSSSSDPLMQQAVQQAKEHAIRIANAPLPPTLPMPKTFSSTSVIRDAMEPFAIGAFGLMWKGRAIVPGATKAQWPLVALKELDDPSAAKLEMEAMTRIGPHPNLVNLLGVFELRKGSAMSIVLEFIDGPGDLHTVVIERGSLPLPLSKFYAGEIGAGLRFIHERGFVFGDMKPENVLITRDGHCKICDFGSAFPISSALTTTTKTVGTVEYMPPEQVSSVHGDWWAFGCVVHFMLTGRPPVFFDSEDDSDLAAAFTRAVTFADQEGGAFIKDVNGRTLVAALCSRNPSARPADGGESHAFFNEFRPWSELHSRKDVPKLPAEKIPKAQLERHGGPWQRRTFSTIHSPLPQAYSIDPTFTLACVGWTQPPIKDVVLPVDWAADGPKMDAMIDSSLVAIPKVRTPAPVSASSAASGTQGGQTKRVRRAQYNYTVAGVDLSAG